MSTGCDHVLCALMTSLIPVAMTAVVVSCSSLYSAYCQMFAPRETFRIAQWGASPWRRHGWTACVDSTCPRHFCCRDRCTCECDEFRDVRGSASRFPLSSCIYSIVAICWLSPYNCPYNFHHSFTTRGRIRNPLPHTHTAFDFVYCPPHF